jgi:hypothetical protein
VLTVFKKYNNYLGAGETHYINFIVNYLSNNGADYSVLEENEITEVFYNLGEFKIIKYDYPEKIIWYAIRNNLIDLHNRIIKDVTTIQKQTIIRRMVLKYILENNAKLLKRVLKIYPDNYKHLTIYSNNKEITKILCT